MQIDCFKEESLSLKITNTAGDNAIDVFSSILNKCRTEALKKGFRNIFNGEERAFIKELTDTVQHNETQH